MATLAIIWRAAGQLLAMDAGSVIEVLPPVACRTVPGLPEWIRGVFVHRGNLIPLVDAERLLSGLASEVARSPLPECPVRADLMSNRVLAIRVPAAGDVPEWRLGLWVESVLELDRIEFTGTGTHPGFTTESARFLGPIAPTTFGLVQLVKAHELFTPEQASTLTRQIAEAAA
jgi:chemotaxis-related protein WspB